MKFKQSHRIKIFHRSSRVNNLDKAQEIIPQSRLLTLMRLLNNNDSINKHDEGENEMFDGGGLGTRH
jgi:hypothetical protein